MLESQNLNNTFSVELDKNTNPKADKTYLLENSSGLLDNKFDLEKLLQLPHPANVLNLLGDNNVAFWEIDLHSGEMVFGTSMLSSYEKGHGDSFNDCIPLQHFMHKISTDEESHLRELLNQALQKNSDRLELNFSLSCQDEKIYLHETIQFSFDCKNTKSRIFGIIQNVSEQKILEQQLLVAQRLEAVGLLAGGVAHEFNNLLQAIMGYTDIAIEDLSGNPSVKQNLLELKKASVRAKKLAGSLLMFERSQPTNQGPLNLGELVNNHVGMASRLLGEEIHLEYTSPEEPHLIIADSGEIEQILLNLLINAKDAMANGGVININLSKENVEAHISRLGLKVAKGEYVVLSVSDQGCGISSENIDKIFEPFFTTKPVGKGTGLGLAVTRRIMTDLKGFIDIKSSLNEGTIFELFFPVANIEKNEKTTKKTKKEIADKPNALKNPDCKTAATILIAEDEPIVHHMLKTVLERNGFKVISATNGDEAIRLFKSNPYAVNVAILDMMMPGKNGIEVFNEISEIRPDTPIIFSSGYNQSVLDEKVLNNKFVRFINKPFAKQEVLECINELLAVRQQ